MTEKPTSTPENQPQDASNQSEVVSQQDLDMFNEWAAIGAAQRILDNAPIPPVVEAPAPVANQYTEAAVTSQPDSKQQSDRPKPNRTIATVLGASLAVGAGYAAHEAFEAPEFSEETSIYTVEPGDGIFSAAQQVEGIESIDMRDAVDHIQADPANIDVLEDGLQPGEQLIIPTSVEGYEADNK